MARMFTVRRLIKAFDWISALLHQGSAPGDCPQRILAVSGNHSWKFPVSSIRVNAPSIHTEFQTNKSS